MIGLILIVAMGCGRSSDWQPPAVEGALFPHASGYDEALAHGADWLERGSTACVACHEIDPGTPFCAECHDTYPHPEGWGDGATHGEGRGGLLAQRVPCEKCHGVEGTAAGRLACTTCHASYPHAEGWGGSGQHGVYGLARGRLDAACGTCHGASLEGGTVAPGCTSCHWSFPHAEGWGDTHGAWNLRGHQSPTEAGCLACHGATGGDAGTAGVSCDRCHAGYPHAEGWRAGHVAPAATRGEGSCAVCHEPGDGPATMPATCAPSCHGGAL